jgi:hypothetical protein
VTSICKGATDVICTANCTRVVSTCEPESYVFHIMWHKEILKLIVYITMVQYGISVVFLNVFLKRRKMW